MQSDQETGIPEPDFTRLVRSALAHLYDHAYLQNHPLVSVLDLDTDADRVTRAQGMRRMLLECIEALRPEERGQDYAQAARAYAILTYRYVDGLSMEEVTEKLALSKRQAYREHRKGLEAVASLLLQHRARARTTETTAGRLEAAQAEVAHLRQAVQPEFLSLQLVLEEILNLLVPVTQRRSVQIRMSSPETWPPVVADRVILRQTLMNLLSYALRVVRADLIVTAFHTQEGLLIDVCESSSPANPQSLSSPDREPDEVSLAVTEALLEVQGGHLEIAECEGRWCAQVTLPTSGNKTVLVIDDNTDIVALFQRYLGGHDVRVVGATDGEQALRLAEDLQPQAIALDVMLPNQDGWEILQRLKRSPDTQHIPVIVCSVLNEPDLALSMGASDYITKPVSQVGLLEVLQRWMGPVRPSA
jgi:CheY-like chemotaxis protein